MSKATITRRQKDISRLLREKKQAYPEKLMTQRKKRMGYIKSI